MNLTNISVSDSDAGVTPVYQSGDTDTDNELDTNETWIYQDTGTSTAGQYMNTGTATGEDSLGTVVNDIDDSHYFGANAGINIEKSTNGQDSDSAPGQNIDVGNSITWSYVVTNVTALPLSSVTVTDSDVGVTPVYQSGDTNTDNLLDPSETWTYQATGTATAGQYANTGTATALDSGLNLVGDTDDSHYYGTLAAVTIEKTTNGIDADTPTGPVIALGSSITWEYTVTNTGTVSLTSPSVTDNIPSVSPAYQSGDTDTDSEIDPGETWIYQATGTSVAGTIL